MTNSAAVEGAVEQLWSHVDQHWDNEAAHEALLQQCASPEQLAEIAKRYRRQTERPERTHIAERQLQRIAALAMSRLEVSRETAAAGRPYGKYVLIALFLLGSVILALNL